MALTKEQLKEARSHWAQQRELISRLDPVEFRDTPEKKEARISRARKDYAFFAETYFPHYAKSRCAPFHISAASLLKRSRKLTAAFVWPRGHAKSVNLDILIPLWLKIQEPRAINVMVLVGKSEENAVLLLSDLQAELTYNKRLIADFGEQKASGSWEEGNFVTQDGCAFFARGRGQSPRGLRYRDRRPDYAVVDDLDDDELCRNPARVKELYRWLTEALYGAMDEDASRFIMAGNLISKTSVLYNFVNNPEVHVSRVNAYDSSGRPSWPERFTEESLRQKEAFMGYRSFQREYMNNPITDGAVFKADWIRWGRIPPLREMDDMIMYVDPSFKSSSKNDYKAAKVWGRRGSALYLIKAFVRQCSVGEMVRWMYDWHESLPQDAVCRYFMEANFLQAILLDEFVREGEMRGYQLPVRADRRKKPDKFLRIENTSPLYERGLITYNAAEKDDPDMRRALDQLLAFEKGSQAHDDSPDADEGAIYILQKETRSESFEPMMGRSAISKNIW